MGHETLKNLKHTNSSRHPFVLTLIWEHVNPYGRFELDEKCGLRAAPIYFPAAAGILSSFPLRAEE